MRTLRTLLLGISAAGLTFAQATTASQTIYLSIQPPIRISATSARVAVEVRQEGHQMVGRAGDRIALRSGPKRKVSAGVRAALPSSAELTARFGNSHTGVDDKVSLDGVDRTLDLMNGIRPNATTEFEVEYRWVTHAGTATLMPETRNVVYTMTE